MSREWYFVRRLREHELPDSPERFEVQVLGDDGRATAVGYVDASGEKLSIDGREIPRPVIEAAKKRSEGNGDYVGPDGRSMAPW
jgi:hypothetical protein